MCDLNASLEQLSVTDELLTENTRDTDHILDRKTKLRKDMKVKFTLGDSEELKSPTRISKPSNCLTLHDGSPCHVETSPLTCSANQWTGFYMIGPPS